MYKNRVGRQIHSHATDLYDLCPNSSMVQKLNRQQAWRKTVYYAKLIAYIGSCFVIGVLLQAKRQHWF